MTRRWARLVAALALATAGGCTERELVGQPQYVSVEAQAVGMGSQGKSDLLFMIDNSPSMDAMQVELRRQFSALVEELGGLNRGGTLDLRVGVVTSDYGAGAVASGACEASPGGQKGLLQAVGAAADSSCKAPLGVPYIEYSVDAFGQVTSNLPPGQDLSTTFTCMASVGSKGCGFEHPLESVRAALVNNAANGNFLRADATLAVVFVTNEDDGSAPPDTGIFDPSDTVDFGPYDTYRQTRFGVECGGALSPETSSGGVLTGCAPATPPLGQEYDVGRYINFFTNPISAGGLKADPAQVALLAITAPPSPYQVILALNGSGEGIPPDTTYQECGPLVTSNCVTRLQHSCQNSVSPAFFGDPSVRLSTVLAAAKMNRSWSICGDDLAQPPDFSSAMKGIADSMAASAANGCLPNALPTPSTPDCTVSLDGRPVPPCSSNGAAGGICWHVDFDPLCPGRIDPINNVDYSLRLRVDRPSGGTIAASCRMYRGS